MVLINIMGHPIILICSLTLRTTTRVHVGTTSSVPLLIAVFIGHWCLLAAHYPVVLTAGVVALQLHPLILGRRIQLVLIIHISSISHLLNLRRMCPLSSSAPLLRNSSPLLNRLAMPIHKAAGLTHLVIFIIVAAAVVAHFIVFILSNKNIFPYKIITEYY